MTELEQYGLIEELDEFSEWMRDSAPGYDVEVYQSLEEQIKDLEHESGDFYDVFVDIQLNQVNVSLSAIEPLKPWCKICIVETIYSLKR